MRTDPRQYEILYILSSTLAPKEIEEGHELIQSLLKEYGASITLEEDWGKKKLLYKIKQSTHGYYRLIQFDMKPSQLASLNEKLRLSHIVLRYIIVQAEEYIPNAKIKDASSDGEENPTKKRTGTSSKSKKTNDNA